MKEFLQKTIREAGAIAREMFEEGISYEQKTHRSNLLTQADIAVSDFFVKTIGERYPDHHIYTEELEHDINPGAAYEWVIDPIDGTFNFAHGIPLWCIMVAVLHNGETILAANYSPMQDKLLFAEKGKGAWLDDTQVHVNEHRELDRSHGHIHISPDRGAVTKRHTDMLVELIQSGTRFKDFGDHFTGCAVASGSLDYFTSNSGSDYDYLAPKLICEEAGAVVSDSDGNPWQRDKSDIVIANPALHKKLIEVLN